MNTRKPFQEEQPNDSKSGVPPDSTTPANLQYKLCSYSRDSIGIRKLPQDNTAKNARYYLSE